MCAVARRPTCRTDLRCAPGLRAKEERNVVPYQYFAITGRGAGAAGDHMGIMTRPQKRVS